MTCIFDIDGTISASGNPVEHSLCQSIRRLAEEHEIIFASARPIRDILPMLPEDFHTYTLIGCNGAMVYRNGSWLCKRTLSPDNTRELLDHLKNAGVPYVVDGTWGYSVSERPHPFHHYLSTLSDYISSEEEIIQEGVVKILVLTSLTDDFIQEHVQKNSLSLNFHKRDSFYDITTSGCDKFFALRDIGIDFENTIAFGNDMNDHMMLSRAAVSVYVGDKEIFPSASHYTTINNISTLIENL